ncbi:MAG: hypothetical protein WCD79_22380 [Chthoniobacteraceae bacterium]
MRDGSGSFSGLQPPSMESSGTEMPITYRAVEMPSIELGHRLTKIMRSRFSKQPQTPVS